MNDLSPNSATLEADAQLTADIKSVLSGLGEIVPQDAYEEVVLDGDIAELRLKTDPIPSVDEDELNKKWREAYVLLRRAFRQGLVQSQWQEILEIGLDYNYAPTKFKVHIGRYWLSIEDIIDGREPRITGRESGVERLEEADAEPRRALVNILDTVRGKRLFSDFKKAVKALMGIDGRDQRDVIQIVLSCNRGEAAPASEMVGRVIIDLYKDASDQVRSDIIAFIHTQYDEGNLRGTIKKPLTSFNVDGEHPFWFLQDKHGVKPLMDPRNAPGRADERANNRVRRRR